MSLKPALALIAALAVTACSQADTEQESADDFASRIGGTDGATQVAQPGPNATPAVVATPAPGAASGPYSPGTATDPNSRNCAAPKVAPFYGRMADDATRAEVMKAIAPQTNIRFLTAGSAVDADARSNRLNVMLDTSGVIRDARCG